VNRLVNHLVNRFVNRLVNDWVFGENFRKDGAGAQIDTY